LLNMQISFATNHADKQESQESLNLNYKSTLNKCGFIKRNDYEI